MTNVARGEGEGSPQSRAREEMFAPEAAVTKFKIEIRSETAALLEWIFDEVSDLIVSLLMAMVEIIQCLHFLASEDHTTLLKTSIGILIVNWIICNVIPPLMEVLLQLIPETDEECSVSAKLFYRFMEILKVTLADLERIANHHHGGNSISAAARDEIIDSAESGMISSSFPFTEFLFSPSKVLGYISPTAMAIIGPLTVVTLTCIVADNKYYLFATLFAPMVDRALSNIRSLFPILLPNPQRFQHRTIPDDGETREGVLWGMIVLFCLESLLVGAIVVLMVLISVSLTILGSMTTALSPKENPELWEDTTRILASLLCLWVTCVITSNVLRLALYQTIDSED